MTHLIFQQICLNSIPIGDENHVYLDSERRIYSVVAKPEGKYVFNNPLAFH